MASPTTMAPAKVYATRASILTTDDTEREEVSVPAWGGVICVQGLSGAERDVFELAIVRQKRDGKQDLDYRSYLENFRAKLVAATVIDPATGEHFFSEADVAALGRKNASNIERVVDVARRLSGFTQADIEALVGESEPGRSDASGSSSPESSAAPSGKPSNV